MTRKRVFFFTGVFLMNFLHALGANEPDSNYLQAVSVHFPLAAQLAGAKLLKIVVDYNNIAYVLSDKGVLKASDGALIRDLRYTPLADKIPVDISIQEGTGHLYYLYSGKLLTNGYAGVPYVLLPEGKYHRCAVSENGDALLAGPKEFALVRNGELQEIESPPGTLISLFADQHFFYAFTNAGMYKLENEKFRLIHQGTAVQAAAFSKEIICQGTAEGFYAVNKQKGDTAISLRTRIPVQDIQCMWMIQRTIWAGTKNGAFSYDASGNYRYYASRRWLLNDKVLGISSDSKGNMYFLSPDGVSKLEFRILTLREKAEIFQENIRQRHIRYGLISNVTFRAPGDLSTAKMTDTDNDGLWSAFYLGSQAFRYAVTREPAAKRYAWEAFEGFERMVTVNPLNGFSARTFERRGYKNSDPAAWHYSQDPEWEYKGTTSSDEFVGYIWIASLLTDFVAETEAEKKRVAAYLDKILTHLLRNNYCFIDSNGKPTLWGRWNPEYINSIPESVGDRKLGSVILIAGLQLGYSLTGKEVYKSAAMRLLYDKGYLKNMLTPYANIHNTEGVITMGVDIGNGGWNHSDDEMAFLTYWVLYRTAFNEELKKKYSWIIQDHWQIEKPERNAVWNLISLGTSGNFDEQSTLWHLREFPLDLIRWTIRNSSRKDLVFLPPNFRNQTTTVLLSPQEAPMHRHNANAFDLDGGDNGMSELAGDEYLLPYWMARYLHVIN